MTAELKSGLPSLGGSASYALDIHTLHPRHGRHLRDNETHTAAWRHFCLLQIHGHTDPSYFIWVSNTRLLLSSSCVFTTAHRQPQGVWTSILKKKKKEKESLKRNKLKQTRLKTSHSVLVHLNSDCQLECCHRLH